MPRTAERARAVADDLEAAARALPQADARRAATTDLANRLRKLAADIEAEAGWSAPRLAKVIALRPN